MTSAMCWVSAWVGSIEAGTNAATLVTAPVSNDLSTGAAAVQAETPPPADGPVPAAVPPAPETDPSAIAPWHVRQEASPGDSQTDTWFTQTRNGYERLHEFFGDRIHLGARSMEFEFQQDMSRIGQGEAHYFVGTVDELQDIQDDSWSQLTVGVYLCRNLGLEYRHDEVRARTFTDSDNNHSDGDFVVEGNVFSAVFRLPLDQVLQGARWALGQPYDSEGWAANFLARFIPYVGVSTDSLEGNFEAATWWANGFSSPESWQELGSPVGTRRNGHFREIRVVNEDIGTYQMYGVSIRIIDHLYVDVNWSSVDAELDVNYYNNGQYRSSGEIPMDYESQSIGIRYFL